MGIKVIIFEESDIIKIDYTYKYRYMTGTNTYKWEIFMVPTVIRNTNP